MPSMFRRMTSSGNEMTCGSDHQKTADGRELRPEVLSDRRGDTAGTMTLHFQLEKSVARASALEGFRTAVFSTVRSRRVAALLNIHT